MNNLKQRMSENGFESNTHYDFALSALSNHFKTTLPCLNIQGDSGRRKTAFANALANAQTDVAHILYHDFTATEDTPAPVVIEPSLDDDSTGKAEPPVSEFDRVMTDACAYSEAEHTLLILDQLQAADFKHHIRLHDFLQSKEWSYQGTTFYANPQKLTVYLISEEPLFHSLQRHSFKVWIAPSADKLTAFTHTDFHLDESAQPVIDALSELFVHINTVPTPSEFKKVLDDIEHSVHTAEDLSNTLFGWLESVDYTSLTDETTQSLIQTRVMPRIEQYIGIEDVEICS